MLTLQSLDNTRSVNSVAVNWLGAIARSSITIRSVSTSWASPIMVKMALRQVSGVSKTDIDLDRREAKVTFDDGKTTVDALTRATKDAGYHSTLVRVAK